MLKPRSSWPKSFHQRHYTCVRCSGSFTDTVELQFHSGSVEPTVGEVLTGATSADTRTEHVVVYDSDGRDSNSYPYTMSIPSSAYSSDATLAGSGTVISTTLESGSWAGGDAVGTIYLSSPSGETENGACFVADASVNGSIGGTNMMTATYSGIVKTDGLPYPEGETGLYKGKRYCTQHLDFMISQEKYNYRISSED